MVELFTKPNCPQCNLTKDVLDKEGIEYRALDVTVDADAYARVTALGYKAAPVVVAGDDHWTGFRPERLRALKG